MTDLVMPGMGGRELAGNLSGRCPGVQVLFTSGYFENSAVLSALLQAGNSSLAKLHTVAALASAVHKAWRKVTRL